MVVAAYSKEQEYYLDKGIHLEFAVSDKNKKISKLVARNVLIYKALHKFKPDIVLSFLTTETLLASLCGFRFVHTLRNDPARDMSSKLHEMIRSLEYSLASKVVFQTSGAMEYFGKRIQRKGYILPNPVDTEKLPVWNENSGSKTFVAACRLEKQKNLSMLIQAFVQFHQVYPDYRLEIYGDGVLKHELQELVCALDAEDYICLPGHSSDIHKIMANAFAFVLSSDYEGLSNSMLEALCIGSPCICTDSPPGGNRSYIQDKVNGLLVPVGDEWAMCQAMCYLAEHPDQLPAMSQNAQKTRTTVSVESICQKWNELLDD